MKKEDIAVVAQLLSAMQDTVKKMEESAKNDDLESVNSAKREIKMFQKKLEEIL